MADRLTKEHRSWNMSRIKGKDTKPELLIRSMLYRMGYRFRVHVKDLPGKPDIVLKKYNTIIFVNGCFWHRHEGCKFAYNPKSKVQFWQQKFDQNVRSHEKAVHELDKMNWRVLVIWECELKNLDLLKLRLIRFLQAGIQ